MIKKEKSFFITSIIHITRISGSEYAFLLFLFQEIFSCLGYDGEGRPGHGGALDVNDLFAFPGRPLVPFPFC